MTSYEFTCPDCRREIAVTEPMREATLGSGCPVCGRSVTEAAFAPVTARAERVDPA